MNIYTVDEAIHALRLLGSRGPHARGSNIRCTCPIHGGDGALAFSGFYNAYGELRFSCWSHHCCSGVPLEAVVRMALQTSPQGSIEWLKIQLDRTDLALETNERELLISIPKKEICLCDEAALDRLIKLYPYHDYWKARGYAEDLVKEYKLTYRSIDNKAVIPVYSSDNMYVGMILRALDASEPKYKWDSPNPKASFLYGVKGALTRSMTVLNRRVVFLVEGTLDVLRMAHAGLPAVAAQTNRLSEDQAEALVSNWDAVMVVPDNDTAGEFLVHDCLKRLSPFMDVGITRLEGIKDPDELKPDGIRELSNIVASWSTKWHVRRQQQPTFTLSQHPLSQP